jgi:hypothetical protein
MRNLPIRSSHRYPHGPQIGKPRRYFDETPGPPVSAQGGRSTRCRCSESLLLGGLSRSLATME